MDKNLLFSISFIFLLSFSLVSATTLQPFNQEQTGSYVIQRQDGVESNYNVEFLEYTEGIWTKLINFILRKDTSENIKICITADKKEYDIKVIDSKDGKEITEKYQVPDKLSFTTDKEEKIKEDLDRKLYDKDEKEKTILTEFKDGDTYKFCKIVNPQIDKYLKFGEESIVIVYEEDAYSQTGNNQTRVEENFTHLEINGTAEKYAEFDGDGDYINMGEKNDFKFGANDFSLSAWVKTDTTGRIFQTGQGTGSWFGYYFTVRSDGKGELLFLSTTSGIKRAISTTNITDGEWHLLTSTREDSTLKIYFDGVLEDTETGAVGTADTAEPTTIGFNEGGISTYFNGSIDEMLVFNSALTQSEITNLYNLNRSDYNGSTTNLVSYWDFDNGANNFQDKQLSNNGLAYGNVKTVNPDKNGNYPFDSLLAYYPFDGDFSNVWTNGVIDNSVKFDNSGDFISIGNDNDILTEHSTWSYGMWVKVEDTDSRTFFYTNDNWQYPFYLYLTGNKITAQARRWDTAGAYHIVTDTDDIPTNEWVYAFVNCDEGGDMTLHINGVEKDSTGMSSGDYSTGEPTYIGKSGSDFEGDELIVFNRTLSDTEILNLYNNQSQGDRILTGDASLIGYWNLDNNMLDSSTKTNDGEWNGAGKSSYDFTNSDIDGEYFGNAYVGSGLYDDSAYFDGDGSTNLDYINIEHNVGFNEYRTLTLMAWVKPDTIGGWDVILDSDSGSSSSTRAWGMWLSSGKLALRDKFNLELADTTLTTGVWSQVAITVDGTDVQFYLNGASDGDDTLASIMTPQLGDLAIGDWWRGEPGADYVFDGGIDEVMIFNNVLNATHIAEIYNNQSSRYFSEGIQTIPQFNITSGNNTINVSVEDLETNLNTDLSVKVGKWDTSLGYNETDEGLIGYYHFDGDALDYSGQGNDGTIAGAVENASGIYNQSMEIDGTNQYVSLGNFPYDWDNDDWSFSGWAEMYSGTSSTYRGIIGNRFGAGAGTWWSFGTGATGTIYGERLGLTYGALNPTGNGWYHYSVTKKGTGTILYINGIEVDTGVLTTDIGDSNNELRIGRWYSPTQEWNGTIDEVMIYNRSLSSSEIEEIYIKGRANWDYTDYKTYTSGVELDIETTTTNILPEFKLLSNTKDFYSPILGGDLTFETYYESGIENLSCWFDPIYQEEGTRDVWCNFTDSSGSSILNANISHSTYDTNDWYNSGLMSEKGWFIGYQSVPNAYNHSANNYTIYSSTTIDSTKRGQIKYGDFTYPFNHLSQNFSILLKAGSEATTLRVMICNDTYYEDISGNTPINLSRTSLYPGCQLAGTINATAQGINYNNWTWGTVDVTSAYNNMTENQTGLNSYSIHLSSYDEEVINPVGWSIADQWMPPYHNETKEAFTLLESSFNTTNNFFYPDNRVHETSTAWTTQNILNVSDTITFNATTGFPIFDSDDDFMTPLNYSSYENIRNSSFTTCMFFKRDNIDNDVQYLQRWGSAMLLSVSYNDVRLEVRARSPYYKKIIRTSTNPVQDYEWHHICGVRDKENEEIYIILDGEKVTSTEFDGLRELSPLDFSQSDNDIVFGRDIPDGGSDNGFRGQLAHYFLHNDSHTAGEIKEGINSAWWSLAIGEQVTDNVYATGKLINDTTYLWEDEPGHTPIAFTKIYNINNNSAQMTYNATNRLYHATYYTNPATFLASQGSVGVNFTTLFETDSGENNTNYWYVSASSNATCNINANWNNASITGQYQLARINWTLNSSTPLTTRNMYLCEEGYSDLSECDIYTGDSLTRHKIFKEYGNATVVCEVQNDYMTEPYYANDTLEIGCWSAYDKYDGTEPSLELESNLQVCAGTHQMISMLDDSVLKNSGEYSMALQGATVFDGGSERGNHSTSSDFRMMLWGYDLTNKAQNPQGNLIIQNGDIAFYFNGNITNSYFANYQFDNMSIAFDLEHSSASNFSIINNTFTECGDDGEDSIYITGENVEIKHNYFNELESNADTHVYCDGCSNVTLEQNYYSDINSLEIYTLGNDRTTNTPIGDFTCEIGEIGNQYPYNETNDALIFGEITDFYPCTTRVMDMSCSITTNTPVTYPNPVQVSGSCNNPSYSGKLFLEDIEVINPYSNILGVGTYNFTMNISSQGGYSSATTSETVTVNKGQCETHTYISNVLNLSSRANQTIYSGSSVWLNGSLQEGEGTINLYNNNSLINSGSVELGNYTLFNTVGKYNITSTCQETTNYTSGFETWWLTVLNLPTSQCSTEFNYTRASTSNKRPFGRLCVWNDFRF